MWGMEETGVRDESQVSGKQTNSNTSSKVMVMDL
jgi:hypothetical protein